MGIYAKFKPKSWDFQKAKKKLFAHIGYSLCHSNLSKKNYTIKKQQPKYMWNIIMGEWYLQNACTLRRYANCWIHTMWGVWCVKDDKIIVENRILLVESYRMNQKWQSFFYHFWLGSVAWYVICPTVRPVGRSYEQTRHLDGLLPL